MNRIDLKQSSRRRSRLLVRFTCIALAILVALVFSGGEVFAAWADQQHVFNSDIRYFNVDPDEAASGCLVSSVSIDLVGSEKAEKIFNFFIGQGMSPVQAAGLMGNMQGESHLEPRLVQYGGRNSRGEISVQGKPSSLDDNIVVDDRTGYGLVQWTSRGRQQGLADLAARNHVIAGDLGIQLQYIMQELNNYAIYHYKDLQAAKTVEQAVEIVLTSYEKPGDINKARPIRLAFARAFLAKYGSNSASPTTTPTPTATDASASDCADTKNGDNGAGGGNIAQYKNPLRDIKNLKRGRIDQGVDYSGDGPVYAIGNGTVTVALATNSGWPGPGCDGCGSYVAYLLKDGPAAGKAVYVSENCTLQVRNRQEVTADTVLCMMHNASPNIELGWSKDDRQEAQAHEVYVKVKNGTATAFGVNFDAFMQKLGAPAGIYQYPGDKGHPAGSLPAGWPTW